jgi:hypothetical protein
MASVAFHLNTQLNNGESPKLFEGSDGFKRDFVYVGDVAAVNLWFWENGVSGIFNLGTGRAESFQAVADATLAYHKKAASSTFRSRKTERPLPGVHPGGLTNLRAAGYDKPFKTVAEGVTEYMAWLNRDAASMKDSGGWPVMGGRHDDVAKSLSHAQGALSPGDNRRDGTRMVPSAVIAHAGSERSDPDAARPRRAGNRRTPQARPQPARKRYDRAYVLPNSFKSALVPFFAGIPHRTGWRGEMRYGLLNDARVLDKDAWPLMVERYVALAYDKGVMRSAKDLPQPLLWPQLQVNEGEKSRPATRLTFV